MGCCTDWLRQDDPELHDLYARKLLIPGWAGEVSDTEASYIADRLSRSPSLRHAWRVKDVFGKRWQGISPSMAKTLAAWWLRNGRRQIEPRSSVSG